MSMHKYKKVKVYNYLALMHYMYISIDQNWQ